MIVVRVELWHGGNQRSAQTIGTAGIANLTPTDDMPAYLAVLLNSNYDVIDSRHIAAHSRDDGVWALLARVFAEPLREVPPHLDVLAQDIAARLIRGPRRVRPQERSEDDYTIAALTGPFYDADAALAVLRIDRGELAAKVANHEVLEVRTGENDPVYPVWQFTQNGDVVAHLDEVFSALASGTDEPWTIALWATASNEEWAHLNAWQWLADGRDPIRVLAEAYSDAARWRT